MCLHVWLQYVSVFPDVVILLVRTPLWNDSWKPTPCLCFVLFFFVYCELRTNGKLINIIIIIIIILYFLQMFFIVILKSNSALSKTPKTLCM